MKRILKASLVAIVVLLFGAVQNKSSAQVSLSVSFQSFYDELSPYGDWISYPEYGYVWRPDNRYSDFQPYRSDGHWVWSDYGWMWVSDYEWGWAPFHYGRWINDSYDGWLWVPDYEWAPAWVVWRGGGDYYGWAPMSPGISVNLYLGNRYNIPYNNWCFAPSRYITSPHLSNYYIDRGSDRGAPRTFENSRQRSQSISTDRNVARQERPYQNRGNQQIERQQQQQLPNQNDQRVERQQVPDQNNRRVERPYQNRGNQQVERQQFPNQYNQRV